MGSIGAALCEPLRERAEATTLADLLVAAAVRSPSTEAVVFPERRVTYAELLDGAAWFARGLLGLGIDRGDHIGILMANSLDYLHALFGAAMLGAVAVPINARFRTTELRHVIGHADLAVILTSGIVAEHADHPARLAETFPEIDAAPDAASLAVPGAPRLRSVVILDPGSQRPGMLSRTEFDELAQRTDLRDVESRRAGVRIRDVAMLLYTSGTTAQPKGCVHTHEGLVRNGIVTGRTRFFLGPSDRFWDPLPMFHVGFLIPMIAVIDAGATILAMTHIDGDTALDMLERERATWLFPAFVPVANLILDHPSLPKRDLSLVRMTMCVGPPSALRRLQRAVPSAAQISTYGSTETGGVITYHLPADSNVLRETTCGTPFRGIELQVRHPETGAELPVDAIGEILVRGYSIMDSYYKDPGATAAAIDGDGWLHTGDLGSLDLNGHLTFHGRRKDMFKVGGENVAAAEVEAVITECPGVRMAQVVAAPDARLGEVAAVFVELAAGADLAADDIVHFCEGRIASFKVPRHVRFVTEWPMSATKIQKFVLQDRIRAELAPTDADRGADTEERSCASTSS